MSDLASLLERFFSDRLLRQRQASRNTIAAYRDTFKLLLRFAQERTGQEPSQLSVADLHAPMVTDFLDHLQSSRGNATSTRNARLAAIHSFFRYAALHAPDHSATIQRVLAIPPKRLDREVVDFLSHQELDALFLAPDLGTWIGRRDRALLVVAAQTGLRVSELTNLKLQDVHLGRGPHVRCLGKGRKNRCTPLTKLGVKMLRTWLEERGGGPTDSVFPTQRGTPMSRDAVGHLVAKHAAAAASACPTLAGKNVTPHTLRHSTAMALLHAGVDILGIALFLGHESTDATQIYLHADMAIKERALARMAPSSAGPFARYRAPDSVLAFLDHL
jgi:site-specific recombinase XerD